MFLRALKPENHPFLMIFSRNIYVLERIWSAVTWDTVHFLSFTKCKKVCKFHLFSFGGTVLSPPTYITRPLCDGTVL